MEQCGPRVLGDHTVNSGVTDRALQMPLQWYNFKTPLITFSNARLEPPRNLERKSPLVHGTMPERERRALSGMLGCCLLIEHCPMLLQTLR